MRFVLSLFLVVCASVCMEAQSICKVFGFPSTEPGYSLGVSACYAGRIGDYMVMAGGCNFATPGNKTYYRGIYAARIDADVLAWHLVGWLPKAAAYGGCVQSGDSLVFIGGCNADGAMSSVLSVRLTPDGGRAVVNQLASLPRTVDNMAVACSHDVVYVVGGNQNGSPSADMMALQLDNGECGVISTLPGCPRVQPVAAAVDGMVYVWGGFYADGNRSVVHTDGCVYDAECGQWQSVAAPVTDEKGTKKATTLSGAVAIVVGDKIVCVGGVNHDIFLDAISGDYRLVAKDDYLSQPVSWYKFNPVCWTYHTKRLLWTVEADDALLARAGAQLVLAGKNVYCIGGELKPAVRTPIIVRLAAPMP